VLLAVAVLGVLTAVVVLGRWAVHRIDALGRSRSFPLIGTALPLLVALAAGVPVVRHAQLESRLGSVAGTLAGHPVEVRCETLTQAWFDAHPELGYVRFDADGQPEPLATITVDACGDLADWIGSDRRHPTLPQVVAVHVLTHEAMHLAGEVDEARTECAAVQRDARTAMLLHATPDQARALAVTYWLQVYPEVSPGYRSAECGPGGGWDEGKDDAPWLDVKSSEKKSFDRLQVTTPRDDHRSVVAHRRRSS
jgi:hypothetical protein